MIRRLSVIICNPPGDGGIIAIGYADRAWPGVRPPMSPHESGHGHLVATITLRHACCRFVQRSLSLASQEYRVPIITFTDAHSIARHKVPRRPEEPRSANAHQCCRTYLVRLSTVHGIKPFNRGAPVSHHRRYVFPKNVDVHGGIQQPKQLHHPQR